MSLDDSLSFTFDPYTQTRPSYSPSDSYSLDEEDFPDVDTKDTSTYGTIIEYWKIKYDTETINNWLDTYNPKELNSLNQYDQLSKFIDELFMVNQAKGLMKITQNYFSPPDYKHIDYLHNIKIVAHMYHPDYNYEVILFGEYHIKTKYVNDSSVRFIDYYKRNFAASDVAIDFFLETNVDQDDVKLKLNSSNFNDIRNTLRGCFMHGDRRGEFSTIRCHRTDLRNDFTEKSMKKDPSTILWIKVVEFIYSNKKTVILYNQERNIFNGSQRLDDLLDVTFGDLKPTAKKLILIIVTSC